MIFYFPLNHEEILSPKSQTKTVRLLIPRRLVLIHHKTPRLHALTAVPGGRLLRLLRADPGPISMREHRRVQVLLLLHWAVRGECVYQGLCEVCGGVLYPAVQDEGLSAV